VYLAGGWTDEVSQDELYRLSPGAHRWRSLARLPSATGAPGGTILDGKFYVVGGATADTGGKASADLQIYDIRTGRWSRGPNMPTARHHVALVAVAGKLYAAGGRSDTNPELDAFERYDPKRRRWARMPPMPVGASGGGGVAARGKVVLLGGANPDVWITDSNWAFDPKTRKWSRLPDLLRPLRGQASAVVGGRIYNFGGSACATFGWTHTIQSLPVSAVGARP
jgi:N-acetylneuraminic acid mutarotase